VALTGCGSRLTVPSDIADSGTLDFDDATLSQVANFVNENVEISPGELKFTKPYSYIGNDVVEASYDPINYIALINNSEPI
jgi:hypothetical protein